MPSELPKMKPNLVAIALLSFLVASCSEEKALPRNSDVICGLNDRGEAVPALLAKNQQCPSCLLGQVESAIPGCPNDRGLLLLGMYSAYKAQDLEQAATYYESMVSSKQADVSQHADAGYIYDRLGKKAKALRAFQLAVANDADAFVQFEMAKLLHETNRDQEAVPVLRRIIEENPKTEPKSGLTVIGADAVSDEAAALLRQIESKN